jgi:hypothetical protein
MSEPEITATTTQITTIVPKLPPAVDGLGDYGWNLARQLRQDFGIDTRFMVGNPSWAPANPPSTSQTSDFEIEVVPQQSATALQQILPQAADAKVLLHYVGYGYAKRGCPTWLINGLKVWRNQHPSRRLVSMVHEVYATGGPIWSSVFWNTRYQKYLAAQLVQTSDACVTSGQDFVKRIQSLNPKNPQIPALPVFSNVGEPGPLPPLATRQRQMVVFGGTGPRTRVYQRSGAALTKACQALNIQTIIDIGPPLGFTPAVEGCVVKSQGILPSQEISNILRNSYAGFFDYPLFCIEKSTILAAYSAHQVLPIGGSYPDPALCGINPGEQYWQVLEDPTPMTEPRAETIAQQAYQWYEGHNLAAQAQVFANLLRGVATA